MRKLVIAILAGCYSALSLAQFSVGVDVARVESDLFSSLSEEDFGYRVEVGYAIDETWTLVAGLADYGEFYGTSTGGSLAIDATAAHLGVEAGLALSDQFGVFAELGIDVWEMDIDEQGVVLPMALDDSGEGMYFGVGAYVNIGESWRIHLSYSDRDWDDFVDVQVFRIGTRVRFGQ